MIFCRSLLLLLVKERVDFVAVKLKRFVFVTYLKIIIYMVFESLMNSYSYCFTTGVLREMYALYDILLCQ